MRPLRRDLSPLNLSRRGVPKHFHSTTIKDYDDYGSEELAKVRELVSTYLNNLDHNFDNNRGLFLYGSNGVGKSMLASIIVIESYRKRYTSRRVTFVDYISEYTRVWNARTTDEREELESMFYHNFKAVEFLCLEEVGKELDTKLAPTVLEDVLRYREEKGLPTIICTNLSPKTLVDKYGQSISSLIQGNFTPVKIVASDKRREMYEGR